MNPPRPPSTPQATEPAPPAAEPAERADGHPAPVLAAHDYPEACRILAVASSTGGPNALATVLSGLPADFPLPIRFVQHMPPIFTSALAEWLRREAGRPCTETRTGEPVLPGHTYLAPGDFHTTVMTSERRPVLRLDSGPPENYCRPSPARAPGASRYDCEAPSAGGRLTRNCPRESPPVHLVGTNFGNCDSILHPQSAQADFVPLWRCTLRVHRMKQRFQPPDPRRLPVSWRNSSLRLTVESAPPHSSPASRRSPWRSIPST